MIKLSCSLFDSLCRVCKKKKTQISTACYGEIFEHIQAANDMFDDTMFVMINVGALVDRLTSSLYFQASKHAYKHTRGSMPHLERRHIPHNLDRIRLFSLFLLSFPSLLFSLCFYFVLFIFLSLNPAAPIMHCFWAAWQMFHSLGHQSVYL